MTSRLQTLIVVATLTLSSASAVMAQVVHFTHGAVVDGQIKTDRSGIGISKSSTYAPLPSAALAVQLMPGDSDLFVFEFGAECHAIGGPTDYVSVQARLNAAVSPIFGGSFLQPQSTPTDGRLCSSVVPNAFFSTISKSWVIRLANTSSLPQTHIFSIWVRTVDDGEPNPTVLTFLDNRIVRLTRYH
jgi:hypothetical protein